MLLAVADSRVSILVSPDGGRDGLRGGATVLVIVVLLPFRTSPGGVAGPVGGWGWGRRV